MISAKVWPELGDLLDGDDEAKPQDDGHKAQDTGLRSPEAATRLAIRGRDVCMMLFEGELDGGPGHHGMVYFE